MRMDERYRPAAEMMIHSTLHTVLAYARLLIYWAYGEYVKYHHMTRSRMCNGWAAMEWGEYEYIYIYGVG